jgi:hypothetical protein
LEIDLYTTDEEESDVFEASDGEEDSELEENIQEDDHEELESEE